MNLTVNSEFGGRYKLIKQLGVGGFAQVWLGEDLMAGDIQIALKIFVSENGLDEASIKVFRDEFKVIFHLNHPNLMKPMHFDISNNTPYLVLPYCEKGSLLSMSGNFDEAEIAKLMYQIGGALAHMHQQETPILHQDIKPENILIDSNDNYYLSDFGISSKLRRTLTKSMSARSNSSGTTAFMAPERFMAKRSIQPASDVFSFGCMMYELITDELPFGQLGGILLNNGAEIPSMEGQCSMMLADIIKRCLSLNPDERPKAIELENSGKQYLNNSSWQAINQPRGAIKTAINHQEKASPAPQALPLDNQKTMPINSNWEFHDGLARVMKDGKYGFVNQNGEEVIAPQYDDVDHFYEQRARVRKGYYWGFIDTLGKIIVEIKYKEAGNFSQGLAWLKDGKLYGYVDLNGYVVIPFEFSKASSFNNDYAIVNSALDPINYLRVLSKNNLVSPPFGSIKRWNDDSDIFLVMDNKKIRYGIFQISKGLIIPTEYDLKYKSDKHITLVKNKKAIDVIMQPDGQIEIKENIKVSQEIYEQSNISRIKHKNKILFSISSVIIAILAIFALIHIINPPWYWKTKYKWVSDYSNGLALAYYDGKYGFVNESGDEIIPFIYDDADGFVNKYAIVKKAKKWGIIDSKGDSIIPFNYDNIEIIDHEHGYYLLSIGQQHGILNNKGKFIVPVNYDRCTILNNSSIIVEKQSKLGLYNNEGKLLIKVEYDSIGECDKDVYIVKQNNKYGSISIVNNMIIPVLYDELEFIRLIQFEESQNCLAFIAKRDGNAGIINLNNKTILPFIYNSIKMSGFYYIVERSKKFGMLNSDFSPLSQCIWNNICSDNGSIYAYNGSNYYYFNGEKFVIHADENPAFIAGMITRCR